jgi:hypothetical protein
MARSHEAPEGAQFPENWASQLLHEKGHAIGAPEQWHGGLRRPIDGRFMTTEEIINKASAYPEWKGRKRLLLEHLQGYQDSLITNVR